jgi:AcrR family transcriptional regulator
MVRLTRAQQQERTRAAVLAAAREEFGERGYAEAKVDRIAARAELTRGAVYSNFPSKRALYLAVLLDSVEPAEVAESPPPGLAEALGAFARGWLDRLPLTGDTAASGNLRLGSLAGVFDDEPGRTAVAQVMALEALLFGLALESCPPRRTGGRRVRLAELVLTLLDGAGQLAERAPGFGDPFDVASACQHLGGLDLADTWDPPHLAHIKPAQAVHETWEPPTELTDRLTSRRIGFDNDGVIVVLGAGRLGAAEEAVRANKQVTATKQVIASEQVTAGKQVTLAVVTADPAEIGRLVRLRVGGLGGRLRRVFGPDAWPGLRVVLDDDAITLAAALGIRETDNTEAAVRVEAGTIVARAHGRGAGHAAAATGRPRA